MLRYNEDMLGSNMAQNFTHIVFFVKLYSLYHNKTSIQIKIEKNMGYKKQRNQCKRKAKGMPRMT